MAKTTNLTSLSKAELVQVLSTLLNEETPAAAPAKEEAPLTSKQQADVLVEESPFTHTSGRVYLSGAMVEAAARVAKTGAPELVKTPVTGKRTAAVVLWKQADDSVAVQNLRA